MIYEWIWDVWRSVNSYKWHHDGMQALEMGRSILDKAKEANRLELKWFSLPCEFRIYQKEIRKEE